MDHQKAESIELGNDVLTPVMNYEQVAKALGRYYTNNLSGAALQRVLAQQDLAEKSGYGGVMQVECCPWHSAKLPEKQRFIKTAQENDHLRTYVNTVQEFLADRPAIALSAVSSRAKLHTDTIQYSQWLRWQAKLLGIDLENAEVLPLVEKGAKVTSAVVRDLRSPQAGLLVLMMGGNHFPKEVNRGLLVEMLGRA